MKKHVIGYNFKDTKGKQSAQNEQNFKVESAQYIADMILELRNLAKASDFNTLQGLLEISYYEAFTAANRVQIPIDEETFLHDLGSDARKVNAVA